MQIVPSYGVACVIALVVLVLSVRAADWRRMSEAGAAHRFWALAIVIAVLGRADTGAGSGLHLLGAAAACGLLGLPFALLSLAAGIAIRHVGDGLDWADWPLAFASDAVVPLLAAALCFRIAGRWRTRHGPIPMVGAGFVAGALSVAVALTSREVFGATVQGAVPDVQAWFALAIGLAVAEANLSLAVLSTIAAQRPEWLDAAGTSSPRRPE